MIECDIPNCKKRYIGGAKRILKDRLSEHIGYIRTRKLENSTGKHFNQPGYSVANMTALVLEQVKYEDIFYRKERETYHNRKVNTYYRGLNLRP